MLLLSKFLISKQVVKSRRFLPIHTYSSASVYHSSGSNNQDYLCTYHPGIEHAGMVEKGRDSDRERDQGPLDARAPPKKVEKEVKKTSGLSHTEKFEARPPNGHHRDYILLLFVGLAQRAPLPFFF